MSKTKVDMISGFLGAGKTTLIQKLLKEAVAGEQVVLIENEFGEIGIDGGFLKDAGIEIREMNSGCICCSLVGDFSASLREILSRYEPDRIIIEPSGVGKLSDVMRAVAGVEEELGVLSNSAVTVADVKKCKMYLKNFGEFYRNQIQFATTIVLSRTDVADQKQIEEAVALIREINPTAAVITTPISELSGQRLLEILEKPVDLKTELLQEVEEHHHDGEHCHGEEHHHHEEHCHGEEHHHDEDHSHGEEHHHHEDHCHGEEHHHGEGHHHDEEHCHGEEHHHHGEHCHAHCHHDHHGHDADEVFESWGMEQLPPITEEHLRAVLSRMSETEEFGTVIRCKGMLQSKDQKEWFYFDLVPGEVDVRFGAPDYTGKVCVIGVDLKEAMLEKEFKA